MQEYYRHIFGPKPIDYLDDGRSGQPGTLGSTIGVRGFPAEIGDSMSRIAAFYWAVLLLLISGAGFRWLEAELGRSYQNPIEADRMARIPLVFSGFSGRDIPIDERVRLASDADSVVYRLYSSTGQPLEISFFAACGGRPRDLAPHRPEVCYSSAGWLREGVENVRVVSGSTGFDARILRFTQGGMPPRRVLVLNYYIVDGDSFADIDGLRLRLARLGGQARSWTQVQIAMTLEPGESTEKASLALMAFTEQMAPEVLRATLVGPIMPIEDSKESGLP